MQDRRGFMKTACTLAACSCPAATLLAQDQATAQPPEPPVDVGRLQWKLAAAEQRFAYLLEAMDDQLGKKTRTRIMEAVGRRCASHYTELADRFKGNLKGYLDEIQNQWVAKVEWSEDGRTFRVFDKSPTCTCPLVGSNKTSTTMCHCSAGWQKATYERITGAPVEATVEQSVLRGDPQCVYRIQLSKSAAKREDKS
jgi:predicted hydrocarbon binding protein